MSYYYQLLYEDLTDRLRLCFNASCFVYITWAFFIEEMTYEGSTYAYYSIYLTDIGISFIDCIILWFLLFLKSLNRVGS